MRAAYQSTALIETDDWDTLDAVTGNAIRSWRRLAGLSVVGNSKIPVAGVRRGKVVAA